jgi:phosphoglycerate dehydrogenase-like enzyme
MIRTDHLARGAIQGRTMAKHCLFITSPLEPEHVERIRKLSPSQLEVIYEADLYPPLRYVADHKGAPSFVRNAEQTARWRAALGRADILLDCPQPAPDGPGDIVYAKNLKWVQTTSSGVGQLIKKLGLDKTDIIVTTARGVHSGPLAEWVFMALLMHFRKARFLVLEQRAHRWERYCDEEVAGRTLLTIGAGDLARGVAVIGRALGMRVIAITRSPEKKRPHADLFDEIRGVSDLRRFLALADAVVMTVPDTDETINMLDTSAIAAMRPGVAFVNIGRGNTIDELAMIDALKSGQIGFAALDVATIEPLPAASPLWDLPNVLICPHSASTVTTENAKIADIFCENLENYLAGRIDKLRNVLDKVLLY